MLGTWMKEIDTEKKREEEKEKYVLEKFNQLILLLLLTILNPLLKLSIYIIYKWQKD